jgi:hypothetical protein
VEAQLAQEEKGADLFKVSWSGESEICGQAEEQRDTNCDHQFNRARRQENKIHSPIVVGFAYANLTVPPTGKKSPADRSSGASWQWSEGHHQGVVRLL